MFGGSFKDNHVGMISQVKYFMPEIQDKSKYVDILRFQGSSDNTTWVDLFTPDENVHEGWNYHKWENSAEYPTYRFYRFYSDTNNGCLINEIKLTGVETVSNTGATFTCPIAVEVNNEVFATLTETLEYSGTHTTNLTTVEPRYGPVTGGTSITFTGQDFSVD
jgi:hypothetical protein